MFKFNKISDLVDDFQKEKKSLTIQQIADKIGVSKTQFDNYRSGRSMPTEDKLEKIAVYFGKDMNYFFTDDSKHIKSDNTSQIASAPVEVYEPPKELEKCYKIMFEQQKEITELTRENERLKNGNAPMNGAHVG